MDMPVIVEVWSVDSLAECLDGVGPALTRKLWSFVPAKGESPKGKDVWHLLTDEEKRELVAAVKEEFPDEDLRRPPAGGFLVNVACGQRNAGTLRLVAVFIMVLFTTTRKQVVYGVCNEYRDDFETG